MIVTLLSWQGASLTPGIKLKHLSDGGFTMKNIRWAAKMPGRNALQMDCASVLEKDQEF